MKKTIKKICIIGISIFLLFSIISIVIVKKVYDKNFTRVDRPDYTVYGGIIDYKEIATNYPRENVSFYSGDNLLAGYIYGSDNDKGLIVLAHGLGEGADSYLSQIMYFLDNGYRLFSFDCTGVYDSEGSSMVGFSQAVLDLDAALKYIENNEELNDLSIFLFGHSWGGYAVTNVLNYDHNISAVVSVAGVNSAKDFIVNQMKEIMGWFGNLERPYLYLYQKYLFKDEIKFSAVTGINKSDIPVLIIHGENDDTTLYNRDSITCHKDEITNQYVEYITTSGIHGGHKNLFKSKDALMYIEEINKDFLELYNSYKGNIPYSIKQAFYEGLDDELISDLNMELMDSIVDFYERSTN